MLAAWYERQGEASQVLQFGQQPDPEPGPGEVRVRVSYSGVNPGDTKKRRGWLGSEMPYPRVIPHSDGAGVIDSVGEGIDPARVGRRVWIFGAQSYRPFGTAAELSVVPAQQAVELPDGVSDEVGACLGIPGITAHRAVFADGPVEGLTVLVHGALGGVGGLAAQLSLWGGAKVIATVRRVDDLKHVNPVITHAMALRPARVRRGDHRTAAGQEAGEPRGDERRRSVNRCPRGSSGHRGQLHGQRRPRRSSSEEQRSHRRVRDPGGSARLPVLADALREHRYSLARERRFSNPIKATGGSRPSRCCTRRRAISRDRDTTPPGEDCRSA